MPKNENLRERRSPFPAKAAARAQLPRGLWPGFENNVEGSFRCPAETTESGRCYDLPNALLACLRA
jgi:hypothetical protein